MLDHTSSSTLTSLTTTWHTASTSTNDRSRGLEKTIVFVDYDNSEDEESLYCSFGEIEYCHNNGIDESHSRGHGRDTQIECDDEVSKRKSRGDYVQSSKAVTKHIRNPPLPVTGAEELTSTQHTQKSSGSSKNRMTDTEHSSKRRGSHVQKSDSHPARAEDHEKAKGGSGLRRSGHMASSHQPRKSFQDSAVKTPTENTPCEMKDKHVAKAIANTMMDEFPSSRQKSESIEAKPASTKVGNLNAFLGGTKACNHGHQVEDRCRIEDQATQIVLASPRRQSTGVVVEKRKKESNRLPSTARRSINGILNSDESERERTSSSKAADTQRMAIASPKRRSRQNSDAFNKDGSSSDFVITKHHGESTMDQFAEPSKREVPSHLNVEIERTDTSPNVKAHSLFADENDVRDILVSSGIISGRQLLEIYAAGFRFVKAD